MVQAEASRLRARPERDESPEGSAPADRPFYPFNGGRTWWFTGRSSRRSTFALRASVDSLRGYESEGWAHFEFTRINIEPIILKNKIEDLREAGAPSN